MRRRGQVVKFAFGARDENQTRCDQMRSCYGEATAPIRAFDLLDADEEHLRHGRTTMLDVLLDVSESANASKPNDTAKA